MAGEEDFFENVQRRTRSLGETSYEREETGLFTVGQLDR